VRRFLAVLGAALFALHLFYWLPLQPGRTGDMDSNIYHQAAQHLVVGQPIYTVGLRTRLDQSPFEFLYAPTALLFLKPFGTMSRPTFQACYYVLATAAFWAFAAALARIARSKLSVLDVLVAGALLHLVPGMTTMLANGNIDIFVLALVAWAFAAPRFAGVLLGVAAALKLYPAVLIAALASRASRRFGAQAAITCAGLIGLTVIVLGWDIFVAWKTVAAPTLHDGIFSSWNASASAAVMRIFVHDMTRPLPAAASTFLAWFPYIVVAVVAWAQRRRSVAKYGVVVFATTVWVVPICWWWRLGAVLALVAAVWIREQKEELLCESL